MKTQKNKFLFKSIGVITNITLTLTLIVPAGFAHAVTNTPPTATNSSAVTTQNLAVATPLTATDVDGDTLTYTIVASTTSGVLSGTAPNLTYTPNTDFTGTDSFTFKANDGQADSNEATVSITVNAPIPTVCPGNNLIQNCAFETADGINPNVPQSWIIGGYGTNSAVFTYPENGAGLSKAVKIAMNSFTDGDAKWVMNAAPVTPGHTFTYTDSYISTVPTTLVLQTTTTSGTTYSGFITVPISASWATSTISFTTPSDAVSVRIFHTISSVGSLTLNTTSLMDTTPPPTMTITPSVIQSAGVTVPYSQTLNVSTTATGPFTWSIDSGSLPVGFTLSTSTGSTATITGTATTTGTNTFVVKVTNGTVSATRQYSITVNPTLITTATVKVMTNIVNDSGGTNTPGDFNITVNGASSTPAFFVGSAVGTNVTVSANANYTVTTVSGVFYTVSYSPDCTGVLPGGDSATCTITLDDIQPILPGQPSPNLILNPSLETPNPSNANLPQQWSTSFFGTNTPIFSYVTASSTNDEITPGGMIAKIDMQSYTSGDAKWVFDNVSVIPGHSYLYRDIYLATVPTQLVVAFKHTDNSITFGGFANIAASPATSTWEQSSTGFTIPDGVASVTVYHTISQVGSLSIDNTSLTEVPLPISFDQGFVSLTFDDGLRTQYTNGLPILEAANLKGSFYIITHTAGAAIVNPTLDTPDIASSTMPKQWFTSGSTNATFTYPVAGQSGNAAQASSMVTGSNAAWYFTPVIVMGDEDYQYSDSYLSSATSDILIQMTDASGTLLYINATGTAVSNKVPAITLASTTGAWVTLPAFHFYVPPTIKTVTVLHRLTDAGSLSIDNISLGAFTDYMTPAELLDLQTKGHEVSGHTQTHPDLATLSNNAQFDQINGGRQDLLSYGISPATTFVYPYGSYNMTTQQITKQAGYIAARSVLPGFNGRNSDIYSLLSQSVNSDTPLSQIESWIDQAKANKEWLILTFHPIKTDLTGEAYGATPQTLQTMTNYLIAQNVPVLTMAQGATLMGAPKLNVSVIVNNTHGATSTPADFMVNITGASASPSSFPGSGTSTVVSIQPLQQYSVGLQTVPNYYTVATSTGCAGSQLQGTTVNCVITVNDIQVNHAPVATNSATTTLQDTATQVTLSASDVDADPLTYLIMTAPTHGALTGTTSVQTYTPVTGYSGTDTFIFKVNDGNLDSNTATVTITISPVATTTPTNLIANPSFDILGANGDPVNWFRGGWGNNGGNFSMNGGNGKQNSAGVTMNSYVDGDVKWYFADVPVTGGMAYTFSDAYSSNVQTQLVARYALAGGTFQYVLLTDLAAATPWGTATETFTAPANAVSLTIFHLIHANGNLVIDDTSLTTTDIPPVSNMISNPSLEIVGATGDPKNWFRGGWGTNTATYTYPVSGSNGANAAKVEITSYTNGDAKWYFQDVNIVGGNTYTFSDAYKSDLATELVVEYQSATNAYSYANYTVVPASAASWGASTVTFTPPANTVSVRVFHLIAGVGSLTIDDASLVTN